MGALESTCGCKALLIQSFMLKLSSENFEKSWNKNSFILSAKEKPYFNHFIISLPKRLVFGGMAGRYERKSMIGNWILKKRSQWNTLLQPIPEKDWYSKVLRKVLTESFGPMFKTCYDVYVIWRIKLNV